MTEPAIKIFLGATLLLVWWWLWAIEYRRYRVLLLKDLLFEARDGLFAAAVRQKLSFDDPAYGMTRTLLNGMLRQAEAISLPHFGGMMLTRFWWSNSDVERCFNERFEGAQGQLTDAGKAAIRQAIDRAHVAIVSHVFHISFVFGLPMQLLKVWYRWRYARELGNASTALETFIVHSSAARRPMQLSLGALNASAHLVGDLETSQPLAHAM